MPPQRDAPLDITPDTTPDTPDSGVSRIGGERVRPAPRIALLAQPGAV